MLVKPSVMLQAVDRRVVMSADYTMAMVQGERT